ncbi:Fic family protein [Frankia sp. R43]|uniref:Fic family protein n=1 Tax=Frankia sp. R43 TaxID=269536 RepID=UPI0006C9FEBF|nr:Fic family protein [Frankia sp. R43]
MITLTEVCNVHAVALGKMWDVAPHPHAHESESPGNFRSHDIQPFAGGMTSPAHTLVPMEIKGWVDRVNAIGPGIVKGEHAIEQVPEMLAGIHVRFEQIHPFLDGNGRTGRLALNLILVRLGWPPAIILKAQRASTSRLSTAPTMTILARWPRLLPGRSSTICTD